MNDVKLGIFVVDIVNKEEVVVNDLKEVVVNIVEDEVLDGVPQEGNPFGTRVDVIVDELPDEKKDEPIENYLVSNFLNQISH